MVVWMLLIIFVLIFGLQVSFDLMKAESRSTGLDRSPSDLTSGDSSIWQAIRSERKRNIARRERLIAIEKQAALERSTKSTTSQ